MGRCLPSVSIDTDSYLPFSLSPLLIAGLKDLTITNEVVPIDKVQRLAKLAKTEGLSLGVCVDSAVNVRQISKELQAVGATIKVLVECNVGQNRCGVETAEEAVVPGCEGLGYSRTDWCVLPPSNDDEDEETVREH